MTEFKKGDRVKVEFEGIVNSFEAGQKRVHLETSEGYVVHIPVGAVTKLHDPLPTKLFSVVKVGDRAVYQRFSYAWGATGEPIYTSFEYMQELANVHGFTVLYAGDDE